MTDKPGSESMPPRAVWGPLFWFELVMALLIFVPAGTIRYWQGWVYLGLCVIAFTAMTLDLVRNDTGLLARRMKAGAGAEVRPAQKVIQAVTSVAVLALLVVSALDHRLHWSRVPVAAVVAGDVAVVLGCYVIHRVYRANRFAAATVRVEAGQTLTDTGPYAVVRHPMYSGAILLFFGTPPALGSAWGLVVALVILAAMVVRLLDEERLLVEELPGYADYRRRVRARLIPGVW